MTIGDQMQEVHRLIERRRRYRRERMRVVALGGVMMIVAIITIVLTHLS